MKRTLTPEQRERKNARERQRWASNPEIRRRKQAQWAKRYREDAEFRAKEQHRMKLNVMRRYDAHLAAVQKWRSSNPEKARESQRRYRSQQFPVEMGDTGVFCRRIGRWYRVDGEACWTVVLQDGSILEEVPQRWLRPRA